MTPAAGARRQASRLVAEQDALRRVALLVADGVPAEELFGAVVEEAGRLFGADLAGMTQFATETTVKVVASWTAEGEPPNLGEYWPVERDGVAGTLLRTKGPVRRDDWEDTAGVVADRVRGLGIRSTAASPITVDGRVWGGLLIHSKSSILPEGIETRMAEFTELVATAIGNIQARADARRLADEQAALRRIATLVAREAPPTEVFAAVAEAVARLLDVTVCPLYRYEGDNAAVVMAAWGDPALLHPVGRRMPLDGNNLAARIKRGAPSARINDVKEATGPIGESARKLGVRSGVATPIVVDGSLWGGIVVVSSREQPLPPDTEARVAQFTELVATAIANTEARAELTASRARLLAAADDERRRVVRDLHDGAQQRLVHTVVTITMAAQAARGNERAFALLREASVHAQRATSELRELAHGILPSALTHGGLRSGVDALASRMPLLTVHDVPSERFPPAVEATAYFIIAEALANVARHAKATRAAVTARVEGDMLLVQVRDDGAGGAQPSGSGLTGLADRVGAVGGWLAIGGAAEEGTEISAGIPIAEVMQPAAAGSVR
jgi:signal transduction histidine kinase